MSGRLARSGVPVSFRRLPTAVNAAPAGAPVFNADLHDLYDPPHPRPEQLVMCRDESRTGTKPMMSRVNGQGGVCEGPARAVLAGLVAAALLLSGCTDDAEPKPLASAATAHPSADPAAARTSVEPIGSGQAANISTPALSPEQRSGLGALAQVGLPVAVGRPVEIALDGPLPTEGVRLTRTYPAPLGKSADAAFMFYDEELSAWRAVPSMLSKDRRTVMAIVHHLSLWTDIVTTVSGAVTGAADWAFDTLGKLVDTRVEPPKCETSRPEWVSDVVYIEMSKTNPLHFCAGRDPKQPDLLTLKARVNRGYGYRVNTSAKPSWSYNSGANPSEMQQLWDAVADVEGTVTKDLPAMFGKGVYVYPGKELAIGVSEDAVRSDSDAALELEPVNGFGFMVGVLSQKLVGEILDQAEGTVAAAVVLAGCADSLKGIRDVGTGLKAANECINNLDVRVAVRLADALQRMPGLHLDARAAVRLAGRIVGLVTIIVEVAMPLFTFIADRNLDIAARQVHVFIKGPVCTDAEAQLAATTLGSDFHARWPTLATWADAPDFEAYAKPKVQALASACGKTWAFLVLQNMNIVGVSWRAMTSWIGY